MNFLAKNLLKHPFLGLALVVIHMIINWNIVLHIWHNGYPFYSILYLLTITFLSKLFFGTIVSKMKLLKEQLINIS
jgi:hypothetical protein